MDTLLRMLNYAAQNAAFEWDLSNFTNDPKLDNIDPELLDLITKGQQVDHPVFPSSIAIKKVISEDEIQVSCVYKMNKHGVRARILIWNPDQVAMFLDYINKHDIH